MEDWASIAKKQRILHKNTEIKINNEFIEISHESAYSNQMLSVITYFSKLSIRQLIIRILTLRAKDLDRSLTPQLLGFATAIDLDLSLNIATL